MTPILLELSRWKEVLSTADYLNAKIRVECSENETSNSFTINGIDMDGNTISEVIKGTNGSAIEGTQVFKRLLNNCMQVIQQVI